jgi:DNA-binding CsgD family transcriptional regulator
MQTSGTTITPKGKKDDALLAAEIIRLYESEADLLTLPATFFTSIARLIDADVVAYAEFHHRTGDFRSLLSIDDDPVERAKGMEAFARHMHSHPFWQYDPAYYGERALRESDFFSDEAFFALPIAQEVFLPSQAHRMISVVMQHDDYVVTVTGYRVLNRPRFSDEERDSLEAFRPHMLRSYRHAQERTLAKLTPLIRLSYAFPDLTPRQLEVASWLAEGKSNDDIATILNVGLDTVKAHVKEVHRKVGADSRLAAAVLAHTTPPFAQMPPLWKLDLDAWGAGKTA